jgi:uncharacterized protein
MKLLNEISLKENDRQAILAAGAILRRQFPVARVVLFGSKARGDDDAESDIDLLVLTNRSLGWQERDQLIDSLFDLQLKWNVVVSLLIASLDEWNGGPYQIMPIRQEIEREGIAA